MTKKEIVKTISEEIGMTQLVTKEIVQKTFDAIIETLVAEGRIELRNFGVFEVKKRKSRKARNPKTGDPVEVSEKFVVTFKPGKEMEERVRMHGVVPDLTTTPSQEIASGLAPRPAYADGYASDGRGPSPSATGEPLGSPQAKAASDDSGESRHEPSAMFGSRSQS